MQIIDVHTHVVRSEEHGREMWSYFLGRGPMTGFPADPPAFHTVEEAERLMDATGVSHMNILMFTWSGKYWRDGQYTLPDEPRARKEAQVGLRDRVVRRIIDNNEWAVATATSTRRFSTFCGINPALMTGDEMLAEIADKSTRGAIGVKHVPLDTGVSGNDHRLWPVYDFLQSAGLPMLTESSGRPSAPGNPVFYREALEAFPDLRLVFAHLGHDPVFGAGADRTVVELVRDFPHVYTDLSLRLPEMARGACSPAEFADHLRQIGTHRVLYGTNLGFVDAHPDPDGGPVEGPQTTWAIRTRDLFLELPLPEGALSAIAAENWRELIGSPQR